MAIYKIHTMCNKQHIWRHHRCLKQSESNSRMLILGNGLSLFSNYAGKRLAALQKDLNTSMYIKDKYDYNISQKESYQICSY